MTIILQKDQAIPSGCFTITRAPLNKTIMTAEASTIGYHGPHQIYDDACDVGIAVLSERTGNVVRFYLSGQDIDGEDTYGWHFRPIPEDMRLLPTAAHIEVLIIND